MSKKRSIGELTEKINEAFFYCIDLFEKKDITQDERLLYYQAKEFLYSTAAGNRMFNAVESRRFSMKANSAGLAAHDILEEMCP